MARRDPLSNPRIEEALSAGRTALEESRFEDATFHLQNALRLGPRSPEQEAVVRCNLSFALDKRALNKEQLEAIVKYDKFSEFARLSESTQLEVLMRLGWAYSLNNDIPRAVALFNQAHSIARKLEDPNGIGQCYFGLGRAYRFVSEIRIARDYYTAALDQFRQVGSWRDLAECYFNIGNIDAREGEYKNALQSINQALAIIGDRIDHELLGRVYNDLALISDNLDMPTPQVLAAWEKCIEHFKKSGNTLYLAVNYNNLAYKLISLGEWERAEHYIRTAIELIRPTSRIAQLGGTLDTLAQLCLLRGRIDEAEAILAESLEAFSSIRKKHSLNKEFPLESSTRTTIGRVWLMRNDPERARSHLERAVDIAVRLGDRQYLSDSRLWLAEAFLRLGEIGKAREAVDAVKRMLRDSPDMLVWGFMMRTEAKLAFAQGHLDAALQFLGQSTSIFEIKHNIYDQAANMVVLARILGQKGYRHAAVSRMSEALSVFSRLGATVDETTCRSALDELANLSETADEPGLTSSTEPGPDGIDGFVAQRLVRASVSRDLLLHEMATVIKQLGASRGTLIVEADPSAGNRSGEPGPVAYAGISESEAKRVAERLRRLPAGEYRSNNIYSFGDGLSSSLLLQVVDPAGDSSNLESRVIGPIIALVEQGLEAHALKARTRRTRVFNPQRLLAEVELPGFICASRAMSRVLERVHKIRSSDVTVLITGESGTGKELIARAVHAGSSRRFNVFLPFNCSAAPREMIESQLFGHKKGSFTGAVTSNPGIIRTAERGTLFLDEIGDLPLELQPKLLRFLQEGEIHPIGEGQPLRVDVRVVAATNADLERAVEAGRFREDLFHRLNVIRIHVPPLRERREEIPALLNHYLEVYQSEAAKRGIRISEEAVDLMVVYDWPGNVRQLCNELRRVVAYSDVGSVIGPEALSKEIVKAGEELQPSVTASPSRGPEPALAPGTLADAIEDIERRMIRDALLRCSGNIARAAKELGLSRKGLYLKLDRLKFKE